MGSSLKDIIRNAFTKAEETLDTLPGILFDATTGLVSVSIKSKDAFGDSSTDYVPSGRITYTSDPSPVVSPITTMIELSLADDVVGVVNNSKRPGEAERGYLHLAPIMDSYAPLTAILAILTSLSTDNRVVVARRVIGGGTLPLTANNTFINYGDSNSLFINSNLFVTAIAREGFVSFVRGFNNYDYITPACAAGALDMLLSSMAYVKEKGGVGGQTNLYTVTSAQLETKPLMDNQIASSGSAGYFAVNGEWVYIGDVRCMFRPIQPIGQYMYPQQQLARGYANDTNPDFFTIMANQNSVNTTNVAPAPAPIGPSPSHIHDNTAYGETTQAK
ncbi:hypothetical protein [Proteus mirabilis]|uniref:hypothetical protein n=1 Tax=Proteus mirabilis TaxID=584 RepID=UPI0034D4F06C